MTPPDSAPRSPQGHQSSGQQRPPSTIPSRPPSSLSQPNIASRPSSRISNSHRTPSTSTVRPSSSLSHRPQSRFSQRPQSRHARSRLLPHCQSLVSQVTGLQEGGSEKDPERERFKDAVEYSIKNLEATTMNKASASVDMSVIDRTISGHAQKARINLNDTLSEALQHAYKNLKDHIANEENDLDSLIKKNRIPDHLQFLIALSQPPSPETIAYANLYMVNIRNPPDSAPSVTWAEILAEEPFEGAHWEGVLDPITVKDGWDSTPSLSPLNSDDLALDDDDTSLLSDEYADWNSAAAANDQVQAPREFPEEHSQPPQSYEHRKIFEELKTRQYWRKDWQTDANPSRPFDFGDPSTLGPAIERAVAKSRNAQWAQAMLAPEKYINEEDMVREVLMALQGRQNIVFTWQNGQYQTTSATPRLIHLSLESQASILSSLGKAATTKQHLRGFTAYILSQSRNRIMPSHLQLPAAPSSYSQVPITQTAEAFADAIDYELRTFDSWCAAREEAVCRASLGMLPEPLVVSLLETEKAIRDEYDTSFEILLGTVQSIFGSPVAAAEDGDGPPININSNSNSDSDSDSAKATSTFAMRNRRSPAAITSALLDTLFSSLQEHMERNATTVSGVLTRVFIHTAEPIWGMVGKWLRDGMNVVRNAAGDGKDLHLHGGLEEEFFIESSGVGIGMMSMGLLDPDFWKEGYSLREQIVVIDSAPEGGRGKGEEEGVNRRQRVVPLFLEHVAALILGTGKAVGLVRALGLPPPSNGFSKWLSFREIVDGQNRGKSKNKNKNKNKNKSDSEDDDQRLLGKLFSVSVDSLSRVIYDALLPPCEATGVFLVKVLIEECELWSHLNSIEDLFLMRKGDALSHFIDLLFAKMDANQTWSDFHFLNTAFGDVVRSSLNAGVEEWIQLSLVRLAYRGQRDRSKAVSRTVKAIDGLLVEYAVPFPLTYIFRPEIIQVYSEVFVFLLQIRRAKSVLERILVRGEGGRDQRLKEELKVFYAMRSRLSWFVNTLLNFMTTYVLHVQVAKFHEDFKAAKSLDEMINLHDNHLDKIQGRCLLKPNTSALHRSILSILDICLRFSDIFVAFAGDTTATHDISRQSISIRHRSRRQRRQRRDVIGFSNSNSSRDIEPSSDEDDDDDLDRELELSIGMDAAPPESSSSLSFFASTSADVDVGDRDFFGQIEKIATELDGLVRFVRRGVESLAGGTSEAAPAFEVLAFALEDWDL